MADRVGDLEAILDLIFPRKAGKYGSNNVATDFLLWSN